MHAAVVHMYLHLQNHVIPHTADDITAIFVDANTHKQSCGRVEDWA